MPAIASLPAELAVLARSDAGPLKPITIRLDAASLAEVDQLAQLLNRADRAAVLRFVVRQGLAATRAQLEAAA
jgi:predicted transcriptional regulator